ncbi:MAG: hypothetical protein AMXMBFR64_17410 [Myxococcales bacterium]
MDTSFWTTAKRTEVVAYYRTKMGYDLDLILPTNTDINAAGPPPPLNTSRAAIDGLAVASVTFQTSPTNPLKPYIRVGQRIYIRDYQGTDVGPEDGKCPYPQFVDCVLRDLRTLATTVVGRRLLHSIDENGGASRLTIVFGHGMPPMSSQCNPVAGTALPLTGAVPSAPVSCEVMYNPLYFGLPIIRAFNDTSPEIRPGAWGHPAQKPADVTLFHELIHADDMLRGIFNDVLIDRGRQKVKLSEMRAVGLDRFDNESIATENGYREERGVAKRLYYTYENEITKGGPALTTPYSELLTFLDRTLMKQTEFVQATRRTFGKRDKILSVEDALWEFNRRYAWMDDAEAQLPGLMELLDSVVEYKEKNKAKRDVSSIINAIAGRMKTAMEALLALPVSPATFEKVRRMALVLERARHSTLGKKVDLGDVTSARITYTNKNGGQSTDFSPRGIVEGYQARLLGPHVATLQTADRTALQNLAGDMSAPDITRDVVTEVLALATSGEVTFTDTQAGSSAGRTPNAPGYTVVYGQWNFEDVRLSTLVHELTHVSNIKAYNATPLMLSYPVTLDETAIGTLVTQRKRNMQELIDLAKDETNGLTPYQRYWLVNPQDGKLPYAIAAPNALSLGNLKSAPGGSDGLYNAHVNLAVTGVLTQVAYEYETVLNQTLIFLHMWGIPATHPLHARVITFARAAYADRQLARAQQLLAQQPQVPPQRPVLPPPRRLERSESVSGLPPLSGGIGSGRQRSNSTTTTKGNRLL